MIDSSVVHSRALAGLRMCLAGLQRFSAVPLVPLVPSVPHSCFDQGPDNTGIKQDASAYIR
jgi:hypothetical protein